MWEGRTVSLNKSRNCILVYEQKWESVGGENCIYEQKWEGVGGKNCIYEQKLESVGGRNCIFVTLCIRTNKDEW